MHFELQPGILPVDYGEGILSLADAKAHCRVLGSHDDDLIAALRDSAVDLVEQMTNLYLARRTGLTWYGSGFGPRMVLGRGPATVVTGVSYIGEGGVVTPIATNGWQVAPGGRVLPAFGACWPADIEGGVTIIFDAGFTDVAREAAGLVTAVRMMTAHLYDNRDAVVTGTIATEVPLGVKALCASRRMPVL